MDIIDLHIYDFNGVLWSKIYLFYVLGGWCSPTALLARISMDFGPLDRPMKLGTFCCPKNIPHERKKNGGWGRKKTLKNIIKSGFHVKNRKVKHWQFVELNNSWLFFFFRDAFAVWIDMLDDVTFQGGALSKVDNWYVGEVLSVTVNQIFRMEVLGIFVCFFSIKLPTCKHPMQVSGSRGWVTLSPAGLICVDFLHCHSHLDWWDVAARRCLKKWHLEIVWNCLFLLVDWWL